MNKNVVMALWHANSRKVAFGLLLFGAACTFLVMKILNSDQWMLCMTSASVLIGGGTLMDKHLENQKNAIPPVAPPAA